MVELSRRKFLGLDSIIDGNDLKKAKMEQNNDKASDQGAVRDNLLGYYFKKLYIALLEGYHQKE